MGESRAPMNDNKLSKDKRKYKGVKESSREYTKGSA